MVVLSFAVAPYFQLKNSFFYLIYYHFYIITGNQTPPAWQIPFLNRKSLHGKFFPRKITAPNRNILPEDAIVAKKYFPPENFLRTIPAEIFFLAHFHSKKIQFLMVLKFSRKSPSLCGKLFPQILYSSPVP